jgi:hypothetical protein
MPEQVWSQHLVHWGLVYAFIPDLFLLQWLQLTNERWQIVCRYEA